jgi:hypothetical protein
VAGNAVTGNLGTPAAGTAGAVSFNLNYVPFNLTGDHAALLTSQSTYKKNWIIRNGVNDAAQDAGTDFSDPAKWGTGGKNGNGAVNFTVVKQAAGGGEMYLNLADYIPAPVKGATPTPYVNAPWYTGPVDWEPSMKYGVFEGNTEYKATVTLTSKKDYSFITYDGTIAVTTTGGTDSVITVVLTFPATGTSIGTGDDFSGTKAGGGNSIIDTIRLHAGIDSLNLVYDTKEAEEVWFGAETDVGTGGLVLDGTEDPDTGSPKNLSIDGGNRVIDLVGAAAGSPLITVKSGVTLTLKNINFMGLSKDTATGEQNNNAPVILVDGGNLIIENVFIKNNTAVGGSGGSGGGGSGGKGGNYLGGGAGGSGGKGLTGNRVGGCPLFGQSSSHTTVRTVPYTAVQ